MQPGYATQSLSGWGRYPVESCHLFRPEKRSEVAATLASGLQPSYIPRGLGRSYGDAALNENAGVIWPILLNRFLSFDGASGVLECESGVSLAEIIQYFLPRLVSARDAGDKVRNRGRSHCRRYSRQKPS